jgi:ectoine hydroxylase-related dioxygenase (phytanoyl-CoA dioxygenase family)
MARNLTTDELTAYARDGFIVVHNLLQPAEVDAFVSYEAGQDPAWRNRLDNHKRDSVWKTVATHPSIAGIARQILRSTPMIVQTMYLEKYHGEEGKGTALHQDTHYLPTEPNTLMACWLAMSDTSGDNGGLCVIPGTHTSGLLGTHKATSSRDHQIWEVEHLMRDRNGKEWKEKMYSFEIDGLDLGRLIRLEVPKGAGVFFSGMTVHGSYANNTPGRVRRAFATHFVGEGTWVLRADVQDVVPAEVPGPGR